LGYKKIDWEIFWLGKLLISTLPWVLFAFLGNRIALLVTVGPQIWYL
jgi:hypothetical protein